MMYSIFDTTVSKNYKLLLSSNNIDDVYSKAKSHLEMDIDYQQYCNQVNNKVSGQFVYESDKNFKSVMILITQKGN